MLLRVVEGNALLGVLSGSSKLSKAVQGKPQRIMGHQEECLVLLLSQGEELRSQLVCALVFCPRYIHLPQPPQDREELRSLAYLLTQLPRSGVGALCFRGSPAPGRYQRRTDNDLQCEFSLCAL